MKGATDQSEEQASRDLHALAEIAIDTLIAKAQRGLIVSLTHSLCTKTVCCPIGACNAAVPPARCALARAIESMHGGASVRRLGELRVFARLSLAECSDVMAFDHLQLTSRWRVAKVLLFPRARQLLQECQQRRGS